MLGVDEHEVKPHGPADLDHLGAADGDEGAAHDLPSGECGVESAIGADVGVCHGGLLSVC